MSKEPERTVTIFVEEVNEDFVVTFRLDNPELVEAEDGILKPQISFGPMVAVNVAEVIVSCATKAVDLTRQGGGDAAAQPE